MNLQTLRPALPRDGLDVMDYSGPQVPNWTPRILVAEDEEGIRHLILTILTDAGFEVNAASDGQQAWEALLYEHFDLLITDNEMPRLTGIQLIERMREAGMSTPVIIASGTLSVERVNDYPLSPVAAVLQKPFDIFELLAAVRHALRTSCGDVTAGQGTLHRLHAGPQRTR